MDISNQMSRSASLRSQVNMNPVNQANVASVAPTGGPVGGHASNFVDLGSLGLAKIMPEAEAQAYAKYKEPLAGLIPDTKRPSELHGYALTPEQRTKVDDLQQRNPKGHVVIMEKVGEGQSDNTVKLDIKIGKSTASKTQLKQEMHPSPLEKKLKMTTADLATGSRSLIGESRGYRVVGTDLEAAQGKGRVNLGRGSDNYIGQTFNGIAPDDKQQLVDRLVGQLNETKEKLNEQGVTFVASSMFMSIDKDAPSASQMKLIDLAHPIEHGTQINFPEKQQQFNEGIDHLINTLNGLK